MLLQDTIEELGSAIINIYPNKIFVTGFLSSERLFDYYDRGFDCRYSVGVYPIESYDVAYAKDNSLILILESDIEKLRYKFIKIKNDTVTFKLPGEKIKRSKVYSIRKCAITNIYNYKDTEKSLLFNTQFELSAYFHTEYGIELEL